MLRPIRLCVSLQPPPEVLLDGGLHQPCPLAYAARAAAEPVGMRQPTFCSSASAAACSELSCVVLEKLTPLCCATAKAPTPSSALPTRVNASALPCEAAQMQPLLTRRCPH